MSRRFIYMIALAMLLVSAQNTLGQSSGLTLSIGGANFQMDDLKYLQEHILSTYPVEGKITSSFPTYTSVSITVFKQLYDHIRVGGGYSYSTTGGKSSYADYSGYISTDMNATSHRLGAYLSYIVLGGDRLDLSLNGRVDVNYTRLIIESYYTVLNYGNGASKQYRSFSPSPSVGGELMFKFEKFSLGMEAGYLIDLKGNLKDTDNGNPLLDPNDTERVLSSDWTGWFVHIKGVIWLKF